MICLPMSKLDSANLLQIHGTYSLRQYVYVKMQIPVCKKLQFVYNLQRNLYIFLTFFNFQNFSL